MAGGAAFLTNLGPDVSEGKLYRCRLVELREYIFTSLIGTCATSATALRHHGGLPSIADGRANLSGSPPERLPAGKGKCLGYI
jgi:hypothetical protein